MIRYRCLAQGLMLAAMLATAACSKEQLQKFAHDLCRQIENCTDYDENGDPIRRRAP